MMSFINIHFLDILDIVLVAFLMYQAYRLIIGTVAFNIVIGLFLIYLTWLIVRALNMELLSSIMEQFVGVGVLALIIVFHPEIRRFLVYIGSNYHVSKILSLDKVLNLVPAKFISSGHIQEISESCKAMSETKTGALIIIARNSELVEQIKSGETIDAQISATLISALFFKNAPLHDGAVIVKSDKLAAAGCILPLTQKELKGHLGLRHRAAIGITESTDAVAVVVSEERGFISLATGGRLEENLTPKQLTSRLDKFLLEV